MAEAMRSDGANLFMTDSFFDTLFQALEFGCIENMGTDFCPRKWHGFCEPSVLCSCIGMCDEPDTQRKCLGVCKDRTCSNCEHISDYLGKQKLCMVCDSNVYFAGHAYLNGNDFSPPVISVA